MKRTCSVLIGLCLIWAAADGIGIRPAAAAPAGDHAGDAVIRLRFADTDVSDVLQAISLRTHANIVFPAEVKKAISINVTAASTTEALNYVTAAAGLAYRQVGATYIVAAPGDLRQALEPFGQQERVKLAMLSPDDAARIVESALPYVSARPAGTELLLTGTPDDLTQAHAILNDQDKARAGDRPTTDVVPLQYATANQVVAMLKDAYPSVKADAIGTPDKPGGVIGLAGPLSAVDAARGTIRSVDVPTTPRQPDRVYRVYDIKYSSAPALKDFLEKSMPDVITIIGPEQYAPPSPMFRPISAATVGSSGASGTSGGATGGATGGTTASYTGAANPAQMPKPGDGAKALVLNGTPADVDKALQLLAQVDVQPRQVMVEVKVVDTSPSSEEQLGLNWNWTPFQFLEYPKGTPLNSDGTPTTPLSKPAGIGFFTRVPWQFQSILSAMVTHQQAKLLADPRVEVVDGADANIFIGDTIRTEVSQASISGTTIQVLEFPVGIILLVRPRINSDGNLTLHVHPVVSTVTSIGAGNIPQTSSREAETTVMVKDGETIVIGGLIRDEETRSVTEIPLLSKIPIIGELFRSRSTNHTHSDILVFITPHIINQ